LKNFFSSGIKSEGKKGMSSIYRVFFNPTFTSSLRYFSKKNFSWEKVNLERRKKINLLEKDVCDSKTAK